MIPYVRIEETNVALNNQTIYVSCAKCKREISFNFDDFVSETECIYTTKHYCSNKCIPERLKNQLLEGPGLRLIRR